MLPQQRRAINGTPTSPVQGAAATVLSRVL
jgi:hypothetical protein